MKSLQWAALAALVGVATPSALAGAPMHRMATTTSYELKLDGALRQDRPLYVTLVDKVSGQPVADGDVEILRPVYRGSKAAGGIQYVPEALPRAADGRFVCASEHHAAGFVLRGAGPAGSVWLSIHR